MKFILINIFLNLLIIFQCYGKSVNNEFKDVKETHSYFCPLLFKIEPFRLDQKWSVIKKTKTIHKYGNKETQKFVSINIISNVKEVKKLVFIFFNKKTKPVIEIRSNKSCSLENIRKIIYDKKNVPLEIQTINLKLNVIENHQYLNPKPPVLKSKYNKNMVALIDTGVNYTLKKLYKNIAVKNNEILGYDFWDSDNKPYDSDPRQNPFYPRHHGTTVFSVIANEAPETSIAIYRFPALSMCKFQNMIEHINKNSIRLVNISMGSSKKSDWLCFKIAATKYKNIIFVVSAGNNGFDIDQNLIYPASFDLNNIITVTSSDQNGRLGRGSNFGKKSVDFMIPAERVEVLDHRGIKAFTGGTSYAAPRMTAMISRYLEKNPNKSVQDIINVLKKRSIKTNQNLTKYGWIPDPLDNYLFN